MDGKYYSQTVDLADVLWYGFFEPAFDGADADLFEQVDPQDYLIITDDGDVLRTSAYEEIFGFDTLEVK